MLCNACRVNIYLMTVAIIFARVLVALLLFSCWQERSCYLRVQEFNSTHSRMRSLIAKHIVQRLSSKRVRQIEIRIQFSRSMVEMSQAYIAKEICSAQEKACREYGISPRELANKPFAGGTP